MNALPLPSLQKNRRVVTNLAVVAFLAGLCGWLYAPTFHFKFVNWDDVWYIQKNPLIQSWSLSNLWSIATESVIRNYAPLTIFSFLIDHSIFGDWAGGYHLVNLLLHAANGVLVYLLLKQLTDSVPTAAASAVLFLVHPVHVESVAWVSSRKGLLSGALILASLIFWLRKNRTPKQEAWGIFFLALALLSKAIAVVVPGIVLCYDVAVRKDKFGDALVRQLIPGFLSLWLLFKTMSAQVTMLGGVRGHYDLNLFEILAIDLVILWQYVGMLLCPGELSVLYDPRTSGIWHLVAMAGIGWGIAGALIWSRRHSQPLVLLAGVSWILLLLPVLNLFPITTLMNDRYLYLPSIPAIGLFVSIAGVLFQRLNKSYNRPLAWSAGLCLMLLVTAGFIKKTRDYLPVWRNDLALWEHAASQTPQLAVVQYQLATAYYNAGRTDEAIKTIDVAIEECRPDELDEIRFKEKRAEWVAAAGD